MVVAVKWVDKKPSVVSIVNPDNGFIKKLSIWKKGDTKIAEAINRESFLTKFVAKCDELVIIDYKLYVDYFGAADGNVYDFPSAESVDLEDPVQWINEQKDLLVGKWQKVRAKAAEVYSKLEKSGLRVEHRIVYPKYEMTVYTGRSKVVGEYNVQGMTEEWPLKPINATNSMFIHFDWISADIRVGALLSGDPDMIASFKTTDPYTVIGDALDGQIPRAEVKQEFMRAVYSLNPDSEILRVFPVFASWLRKQTVFLQERGYTESILGRRFYSDGTNKGKLRSVNAILQGSVAHAINNVLWQVVGQCGDIIITEQHDSMIVAVKPVLAVEYIKRISEIMYRPFAGLVDADLTMPLKVAVGKAWRQYKFLKDFR